MSKTRQTAEIDHSPVTFPAGSFSHEALQDKLDKVAAGDPDKRDAAIDKVFADENQTVVENPEVNTVPGYKTVERTTEIVPGLEITESVQVFDTEAAEASDEAQAGAAPVLPTEPVGEAKIID